MKSINEQIEDSKCYGIAFSSSVRECKICEVRKECKAITENKAENKVNTKPESPLKTLEETVSKELSDNQKQSKTKTKANKANYPCFKNMKIEELEELAEKRHADDSWKKYDNLGIRRMRLTMALKKTY